MSKCRANCRWTLRRWKSFFHNFLSKKYRKVERYFLIHRSNTHALESNHKKCKNVSQWSSSLTAHSIQEFALASFYFIFKLVWKSLLHWYYGHVKLVSFDIVDKFILILEFWQLINNELFEFEFYAFKNSWLPLIIVDKFVFFNYYSLCNDFLLFKNIAMIYSS